MKNKFLFEITKTEIITSYGAIKTDSIQTDSGIFAKIYFRVRKRNLPVKGIDITEVLILPFENFKWHSGQPTPTDTTKLNTELFIYTLFLLRYFKDEPLILDPSKGYILKFYINNSADGETAGVELFLFTEAEWLKNKKAWDAYDSSHYKDVQIFLEKPNLVLVC